MRLDRIIQILLPHDEKFYAFFEEATRNLVSAAELLPGIGSTPRSDWAGIVEKIHEYEHHGDVVTHKIFGELNSTFVTPFDREDIHLLAAAIDDVMDFIDGCASRIVLYRLEACPPRMTKLMEILRDSVLELQKGIGLVRDFRKTEKIQDVLNRINTFENQADALFEEAVADLFEHEKNPINLIKLKEIYVALETATDKCEDAANVIETLLVKHA